MGHQINRANKLISSLKDWKILNYRNMSFQRQTRNWWGDNERKRNTTLQILTAIEVIQSWQIFLNQYTAWKLSTKYFTT